MINHPKPYLQIPLLKLGAHGGTRVMVEFANYVASQNVCVRLLLPKGRQDKDYEFHRNVEVKEVPCLPVRGLDYLTFMLICPFYMRCGSLVANFFPTFFAVCTASVLFRCPYIYFVQDIETWFDGTLGHVLNAVCRLTWRSRRMIATSPYVAAELQARGHRLLQLVQLGVAEIFLSAPSSEREKLYDLVCFPRREPWKRTDRIKHVLDAYRAAYGNPRILCVGQDQTLLAMCKSWGCDVVTPQTDQALVEALDQSRVVLFTSEREGLGLPPLEGMARGLPAIVYDNEGIRAYMRNGENGFIVADGGHVDAAKVLHTICNDRALYHKLSLRAASDARTFSMTGAFQTMLHFLLPPKE